MMIRSWLWFALLWQRAESHFPLDRRVKLYVLRRRWPYDRFQSYTETGQVVLSFYAASPKNSRFVALAAATDH